MKYDRKFWLAIIIGTIITAALISCSKDDELIPLMTSQPTIVINNNLTNCAKDTFKTIEIEVIALADNIVSTPLDGAIYDLSVVGKKYVGLGQRYLYSGRNIGNSLTLYVRRDATENKTVYTLHFSQVHKVSISFKPCDIPDIIQLPLITQAGVSYIVRLKL